MYQFLLLFLLWQKSIWPEKIDCKKVDFLLNLAVHEEKVKPIVFSQCLIKSKRAYLRYATFQDDVAPLNGENLSFIHRCF